MPLELELGEPLRERGEDLELDRRRSRKQAIEFAIRQHEEPAVGLTGGGGGPGLVEDQRHLREEIARPLHLERSTLTLDPDLPGDDDEELVAYVAFAKQDMAGRDVDLIGKGGDGLEVRPAKPRQQRNLSK